MNRCKCCGDQIDWIHDSKQWVPVEYRPVVVMPDRARRILSRMRVSGSKGSGRWAVRRAETW